MRGLLDWLLRPRSIRVVGRRRPADQLRFNKRLVKRGTVDLAIVAGARCTLASVKRAAASAHAVVVLPTGPVAFGDLTADATVLGPGAGLWSPILGAGISSTARRARERRPVLVVTQTRAAAAQALRAATSRGLRGLGAVCVGSEDAPLSWADVAAAAAGCDPAPVVLVHLQSPISAGSLARVAAHEADVVLVDSVPEPVQDIARQVPHLAHEQVARELGLVVVDTMAEAVEAAFLLGRGVRRRGAVVHGVARDLEEAALLEDAMWRNDVQADVTMGMRRGSPADRVDCLLGDGEPPPGNAAVSLVVDGDPSPAPGRAVEATLGALAAMQRPSGWRPGQASRRPRVRTAEARRLLDGWPSALDELQVKALLSCYQIRSPAEELTSSASGASRAARKVGFPVSVKAVGPGLHQRLSRGAVALDVDNESAARQAFREVANACGVLEPAPMLEGLLVSAMAALPATLDCTVAWPPGCPPLLMASVRVAHLQHLHGLPLVLACPASEDSCETTATELLMRGQLDHGPARVGHLARFLSRLSWLGADLDGRMRWLRLDTVSPPTARTPPLVIDGCGDQIESFRAPEL